MQTGEPDQQNRDRNGFVRQLRRVIVFVVGLPVIAIGVVLLFLPGPGLLFIAAGIGIMAVEFDWAKRLMTWIKSKIKRGEN